MLAGGAVGVGIGFGLQKIFSNFIPGVILLLEKTIKEGDFFDLQSGIHGHVRMIGLHYTRATTSDEVDVIVPNTEFVSNPCHQLKLRHSVSPRARAIRRGLRQRQGRAVKAAALRAAASFECTVTDLHRKSDVWLLNVGESSLDFELTVWVSAGATDFLARVDAACKWKIHNELIAAHIDILFPQRDLHLGSGELPIRRADS